MVGPPPAVEVLANLFASDAEPRRWTAEQIAESALWAGIHCRSWLA